MSKMYLLDTSAFRSLSGQSLAKISQHHALFVSSFCFLELISHLDESESFHLYKQTLMKFRYVQALDEPRSTIEALFLPHDTELQNRVLDSDLIAALLAALRDSNSLDEFYSKYVSDSNGTVRLISDCAARSRDVLHQEEEKFLGYFHEMVALFKSRQSTYASNSERHRAIMSLLEGSVDRLKRRGASDVALRERLIPLQYIYFAYIFHRALRYYETGKINLERNDYEDAHLCLHLIINTPFQVVAVDKGLRKALNETIILLNSISAPKIGTTLQMVDTINIDEIK